MVWLISSIIIFAIGSVILYHQEKDPCLYCALLFLSILFIIGGNGLSINFYSYEWVKIGEREIISLQDSKATEGAFFLGTGSLHGKMHYSMYARSGNGYELIQLNAHDVQIKNSRRPRLSIYRRFLDKKSNFWTFVDSNDPEEYYTIYIPEGTIKHKFNLNTK